MDMKQMPFEGILGGPGLMPGIVVQNTPDPGQPVRGAVKVWLPHIDGSEEPLPSTLPEATRKEAQALRADGGPENTSAS